MLAIQTSKFIMKYRFISGLPRSGSTLLSAILSQNPRIVAGMTSPVGGITSMLRAAMSHNPEISTLVDDEVRKGILTGVFHGHYAKMPPDAIAFDTNRNWSGRLAELNALFGSEVRVVCMVRSPAWIFDSVERIVRKNPLRASRIVPNSASIETRLESVMKQDGLIGGPLGSLMSGLYGEHSQQLLVVEYDALCADPRRTMNAIYDFCGLPSFDHDYGQVEYSQESFDDALMTPGLHTVSGPVAAIERKTVLPPDMFNALSERAFWRSDFATSATRIIAKPAPTL